MLYLSSANTRRYRKYSYLFGSLASVTILLVYYDRLDVLIVQEEYGAGVTKKGPAKRSGGASIITKVTMQNEDISKLIKNSNADRIQLVKEKCAAGWRANDTATMREKNLFYYDPRRKLGYCHAAKAGCTFWLRIFTYLALRQDLNKMGLHSPFSIKRLHIHTGSFAPKTTNYWPDFRKHVVSNKTFRFFVARNPYARLLSVYLDKYYLLGFSQSMVTPLLCDKSQYEDFDLFLDMALGSSDHHLIPISELCDPCEFKPHAIVRSETFIQDSQFVLDVAGYGWLLRHYNHSLHVDVEIENLVFENFAFLHDIQARHGQSDCLTSESLARRLWNVFQYNGYIPSHVQFPSPGLTSWSDITEVIQYFKTVARQHQMSADESIQQRQYYLSKFYSTVSLSKKKRIIKRYRGDFDMFGYSTDAPKLEDNTPNVVKA